MHLEEQTLLLAASDLANHLACGHLTWLDRQVAHRELTAPVRHDPALEALRERGRAHERDYVAYLRSKELEVVELRDLEEGTAVERTLEAARRGADVIVQAALRDGRWAGRADLLVRVEGKSDLGDWAYEVVDTKLAQETRAGTVLQLCLYSDLMRTVQGRPAERMRVVKPACESASNHMGLPHAPFAEELFRFADHQAYYR